MLLREWTSATSSLDLGRELSGRWFQVVSAWDIWRDHPWFGTGGWGYKYLVAYYLPPEHWGILRRGTANVHNDFFQFLCEFGLLGISLLTLVFLPPLLSVRKRLFRPAHLDNSFWADPFRVCLAGGLLLMLAHSMIDLPFRNPAVFTHGALFLAWIGATPSVESVWTPRLSWADSRNYSTIRRYAREK
jgi:O-antigen ligase